MGSEITILIADDHPVFQRGMRQIIATDPELRIVAVAANGDEALAKLRALKPQVAILDVDMPKRDGFEVLKAVKEEEIPTNIVFLTMYKEQRFLNAALDAGVKGYVVKDSAIDEIGAAVRAAARGEKFVSAALTNLLLKRLQKAENNKVTLETLTTSERRVLKLVAESKSSKQIADELFISVRTVENHRSNICHKLELEGKNALLTFALTNRSALE
ncbi:MAG: response regulator transcription factor [Pyrinomonadaceae bacterium]